MTMKTRAEKIAQAKAVQDELTTAEVDRITAGGSITNGELERIAHTRAVENGFSNEDAWEVAEMARAIFNFGGDVIAARF
jgi:hypothetical protein